MMAGISISQDDVIDVEFETVASGGKAVETPLAKSKARQPSEQTPDQLSFLRNHFADPANATHPDNVTPAFMIATLICAFVVFWVSGGHALLY
jgi:hypothetical protein